MLFKKANRGKEVALGVFKNVSGGVMSGNYVACFCTTAASLDGVNCVTPAAGNNQSFAGIVDADVADTAFGLYQCYGYRDSVRIFATGTNVTVAVGIAMGPGTASNGVNSTGLKDVFGPVIAMEAIGAATNTAGGFAKALIKAM